MSDIEEVAIRFTVTEERAITTDPAAAAKLLGVTKKELLEKIENGDLPDVTPEAEARLLKSRSAEVESQEFEIQSVEEA